MSETAEEATNEPNRTLSNKEWNQLLQALKQFVESQKADELAEQKRFKDEQRRFREEKKIWRAEKWLLIANLVVSTLHLIFVIFKLVKR